ncbi:four helix bundle protein [candidate division WS5 bacterium]|uniref:Four helix bundle protein n=1 Tax=candidate division WS5 bacterium TaxID=2093353 RepID=A0A419DAW0_9BACT|nr:MAG: four helix bundle protein [candidate division WS5 bacterium]
MTKPKSQTKTFDLEERTTEFAKQVVRLCKTLPRNPINNRSVNQVVGSSGSVGANYREANDALGKADFINKLRISRREAKETIHWLDILKEANQSCAVEIDRCTKEATELRNILSSIISKVL